ncbi:MAG: hypothetical protein QM820_40060 [Minicystis sp.]
MLVGGVTLVLFPLAWLLRRKVGLDRAEFFAGFLTFHAATLINDPHFAVTYLLFYKDVRGRAFGGAFPTAQRARYIFAGLVVPVALVAWASAALTAGSVPALGFMIELMFFLVGWHYVKQGFGVLTVLSARRGFRFTDLERKVILAHCFAGWAYAWANPAVPAKISEEKGVVYTALAHPRSLEIVALVAFGLSSIALVWALARRWRRERRTPPLGPLTGFLITIWLWTVYSSIDRIMMYVIPALHSIQYLYIVWLLKRNEARAAEGPPLFGKPTALRLAILAASAVGLGWILFRGGPAILDARLVMTSIDQETPSDLGETPYFCAVFVAVNIHHYFMDYVIWRRENPDTRYLRPLAAEGAEPALPSPAPLAG